MKLCNIEIVAKNQATSILIFLMLTLNTGCNTTKVTTPKSIEIIPFEETNGEYYKNLQIVEELTLETEISSQVIISQKTPNIFISYLKANLKIVPIIDQRQEILSLEISPPGKNTGDSLEYQLDYPKPGRYEFKVKTETILKNEFVQVKEKIPFPLRHFPEDQFKYIKPSSIIDSDNEEIQTLASSIAEQEDDLYRVVFKASKWVRENVQAEYDNSTISTSQKASWVLEHKKGVCDEDTNLFIGILRSLGIPAKFITGFVGLSYNGTINFKPHSWAEVYFPSIGWIPFDVAYNQLGFIDATHVKLIESIDTSDPLTSYEWQSFDISDKQIPGKLQLSNTLVTINDLKIKTEIKNNKGVVEPLLKIESKVWYSYIDMGSCNVIEATIINPYKFYVITDAHLRIPNGLEIMGQKNKMILMEPETRKTLYWIVKPATDIKAGMRVKFPVNVISSEKVFTSAEFFVGKGKLFSSYRYEWLKNEVEEKTGVEYK